MLEVSFHLVGLAAMLIGIDVPVVRIELDSLNDPTLRPIPGAGLNWGRDVRIASSGDRFKHSSSAST